MPVTAQYTSYCLLCGDRHLGGCYIGGEGIVKKGILIGLLIIFVTSIYTIKASADSNVGNKSDIKLDGVFKDWVDRPEINVEKDDENLNNQIELIKYMADNNYLYLYVKKNATSKIEQEQFSVIITNAISGRNKQVQLFNKGKTVSAALFDITTSNLNGRTLVQVSYNNQNIETTLSGSKDCMEIEFRIPLSKVGLNGLNKEVQFALRFGGDKNGEYVWLPKDYPITIATGSSGAQYTSVIFFLGVLGIIFYRKYIPRMPKA